MEQVRVAAVHRPPRRWPLVVAGILLVLVWVTSGLARFFLDLLWFREVGKTQVFWGVLGAEVGLGLLTGLGTAVIVGGNLWVAERIAVAAGLRPVEEPGVESVRGMLVPLLGWLRLGVVAVLGLLVGLHGASQWRSYMLWRNQVRFGDSDAQFGRDIGFYVFSLPLQRAVFGWLLRHCCVGGGGASEQPDYWYETSSPASRSRYTVSLRGLPLPTRRHRPRGPLVSALRPVVPRR
jgi:uncharacterized membrane protein (UPF0182 family)